MKEITAICKTDTCSFKDIPSIFLSQTEATQCAECGNFMEVTVKEVTDGTTEVTEQSDNFTVAACSGCGRDKGRNFFGQ